MRVPRKLYDRCAAIAYFQLGMYGLAVSYALLVPHRNAIPLWQTIAFVFFFVLLAVSVVWNMLREEE